MTELPVLPRRPRSDYIAIPARLRRRLTARARGWYPGWPEGVPAHARKTVEVPRPIDGRIFKVSVDARLADHVGLFLAMIQEVGYPLIGALETNVAGGQQGGVGSYANRPIKEQGPDTKPSIHSSALALDLWSRSNPQRWGQNVAFASTQHPLAVRIGAAGDFFWGGWFWDISNRTYLDAMHYEYNLRPQDVATSTARMVREYEAITGELAPSPPPEDNVDVEEVKRLQAALNEVGTNPPLVVDGIYGPATDTAVRGLSGLVAGQIATAESSTKEDVKRDAQIAIAEI